MYEVCIYIRLDMYVYMLMQKATLINVIVKQMCKYMNEPTLISSVWGVLDHFCMLRIEKTIIGKLKSSSIMLDNDISVKHNIKCTIAYKNYIHE